VKRLVLMRHAKSSWSDERLSDRQRPLSKRGERDAPRMAARLAARGSPPTLILSSPAVRALRTAEALAEQLGSAARLVVDDELYLASPRELLAVVAEQPDAHASLALVGHNPGLTELVNRLLPSLALANLPTAGCLGVDLEAATWTDAIDAPARLAFYDYPKNPDPPGGP
jgi:phosphohistidine phosphatase